MLCMVISFPLGDTGRPAVDLILRAKFLITVDVFDWKQFTSYLLLQYAYFCQQIYLSLVVFIFLFSWINCNLP